MDHPRVIEAVANQPVQTLIASSLITSMYLFYFTKYIFFLPHVFISFY